MGQAIKADLRRLEKLGKPVVAAINGAALGGGLEITLACHHRIVVDDPKVDLGLPEATLGLLPGGGGVTRTVRMFGIQSALMDVLLQGPRFKPAAAKEKGLVDELVTSRDDLVPAAKKWVKAHKDDPHRRLEPVGPRRLQDPRRHARRARRSRQFLPAFPAMLRKQTKGAIYPATRAIMAAAIEGAQVDFDTASRIESRYLAELITGSNSKNMIQAFFFDLPAINRRLAPPRRRTRSSQPTKVGVLGAGMMGAGIAYSCARAGMEVVLKDVAQESAEKGKAYSEKILAKAVERGKMDERKKAEILDRITPTTEANDFKGCDLVIEAVFEDPTLKAKVFGEIQDVVNHDALLCSNTSTLPITELAEGVNRPDDFIGLHFFSPGGQDAARRDHPGREDHRRRRGQGARRGDGDPQDPDRGQRQPRLLHQPGDRHDGQRGPGHARRGRAPDVRGARRDPGRLPGRDAAALRRAEHGADGQDREGHRGRCGRRLRASTPGRPWWRR